MFTLESPVDSVHSLLYILCRQQQLFHVLAAYSVYNPVSSTTAVSSGVGCSGVYVRRCGTDEYAITHPLLSLPHPSPPLIHSPSPPSSLTAGTGVLSGDE